MGVPRLSKWPILCHAVSGWDDLFTKCSENLNSLVAMKVSPYYKGWNARLSFLVTTLMHLFALYSVRGRCSFLLIHFPVNVLRLSHLHYRLHPGRTD